MVIQIGAAITCLYRIGEGQGAGAAAAGVIHHSIGGAGFQCQLRCTGHGDRFAEVHLHADSVARFVSAIGGAGIHGRNGGHNAINHNGFVVTQ